MKHSYVIIDDMQESVMEIQAVAGRFPNLYPVAFAYNYDDGLNAILEHQPDLVFLEIDPQDKSSNLSLNLINELHRFLKVIPKIIITTKTKDFAFEAIKFEALDYLLKPLELSEFRKAILRFEKSVVSSEKEVSDKSEIYAESERIVAELFISNKIIPEDSSSVHSDEETLEIIQPNNATNSATDKPMIICVKSYGDYRFIEAKDICYLQADNNSTDIHLNSGEMITAFKTLKHFEGVLHIPFIRIHNSHIVNSDYVSRIHTGNSLCYIKGTAIKLPFSKSYKSNIDILLNSLASGNYLEI